jgi:hypothetical protein
LALFLQSGPFWVDVLSIRSEWGITAQRMLPSKADTGTYCPIDLAPEKPAPYKATKALGTFFDRWDDALRPLRDRFVPDGLRRGPAWDEFLGACVMCDPPDDCLEEFAAFGTVHPSPFWPVVDCEEEEINLAKLHSMVAPPVERVFKESYEEGKPVFEYRIVVDEQTTLDDVKHVFRAIKAAYEQPPQEDSVRYGGGAPTRDRLQAVQCANLYDRHNGRDPADRRRLRWSYERLAERFRFSSARSAKAHVELGREIIERNRVQ